MTANPIKIFDEWFNEAKNNPQVKDHTEICLATADKNGKPSVRIILLKNFDERGFCFFTNYNGRKSKELSENPNAAICIYWPALDKQIRIEGRVEKVSDKENDDYFASRSRESRIGAIASNQSQDLENRSEFLDKIKEVTSKFEGKEVTRPANWGGWRLVPEKIEFWKAEKFRYHHRELFYKKNNQWQMKLLYP
jgi:pyridoxamine 5'-phosphate oxidase